MAEYIEREEIAKLFDYECRGECVVCPHDDRGDCTLINQIPTADVLPIPDGGIGEVSDGYHTFNGLYYQRMVLFAALVNAYPNMAWKSWKHEDGKLCFGGRWFIVGIDTPKGSYTYHYEEKYWNWFECEELPVAPHWDGHTEKDVTRLLSLPDVQPVVHSEWKFDPLGGDWECLVCGYHSMEHGNFCTHCGADMRKFDDQWQAYQDEMCGVAEAIGMESYNG